LASRFEQATDLRCEVLPLDAVSRLRITTTPCVNRREPEAWNERDPRSTSQRVGGSARVLWGLSTVRERSLTALTRPAALAGL
jgi:hypothetical protein